jgi:hypothetical protein
LQHPHDRHLSPDVDMLATVQAYYRNVFPTSYVAQRLVAPWPRKLDEDKKEMDAERQVLASLLAGKEERAPRYHENTAVAADLARSQAKHWLLRHHLVVAVPHDPDLYRAPYDHQDNLVLAFATLLDEQRARQCLA